MWLTNVMAFVKSLALNLLKNIQLELYKFSTVQANSFCNSGFRSVYKKDIMWLINNSNEWA